MRDFVRRLRSVIDSKDSYLIVALVNAILSQGKASAFINRDPMNTPGLLIKTVLYPEDIIRTRNGLGLRSKRHNVQTVPSDKEVSLLKWRNRCILVEGMDDMVMLFTFITEDGNPVNMTNIQTVIASFGSNPDNRERIINRLN